MTALLLLRHAESEWNALGRWQGHADPPLSARGHEQARAAGRRLIGTGVTALASSDLQRATTTARAIGNRLGLALAIDPALREYDVGQWSGLTRVEIQQRWPGDMDRWRQGQLSQIPGGESRDAFVARIAAGVARLGAANPDAIMLVITHGGVIAALERSLGAESRRLAHLSGRWILAGGDGLRLGAPVSLLDDVVEPAAAGGAGVAEAVDAESSALAPPATLSPPIGVARR